MNIRERILARRDLDAMRLARDITGLADALNTECSWTDIPANITAKQIVGQSDNGSIILNLLTRAAIGESVMAEAAALMSDQGAQVMIPGYLPPLVDQFQVAVEMYNPDGTERED